MDDQALEDLSGADLAIDSGAGPSSGDPAPEPPLQAMLPYPGLRPFRPDETDIFFGREAALDAMAERLGQTKFLAVLGPSGCGKSSLVRTGLYTTLRLGLLPHAGGRWRIAEARPGRQPIRNLAKALLRARADMPVDDAGLDSGDVDQIAEHLKRGPRSVIELAEDSMLEEGRNLLLVIDQFEELFRFRDYAGREEAEAFVALLLESARSALPIHVVITMRSEYLGACSLIPGLAEQISDGMFLTPRMTREECREAIERPARARGFDIDPELVAQILNDLQTFAPFDSASGLDQAEQLSLQADQLPLMQHLLNRMWRNAQAERGAGQHVLTLDDYDGAGGLTGALDAHGKEVVKDLVDRNVEGVAETVENVFRALVDGPSVALAVRCPQPIRNLVAAAGGEAKRAEVEAVVDAFRGTDCNFLRTSEQKLNDDTLIDIGHESLIRRWTQLRQWFEAEVEAAGMWRRLSQDAELWKAKKGELLRGLGLTHVDEWWERARPTPYLAGRYKGDLASNEAFLNRSKAARERRARIRKYSRGALAAAAAAIIALLLWGLAWRGQQNDLLRVSESKAQTHLAAATASSRDFWRLNSAFREDLGRKHCARHLGNPTPYQRCIDERVDVFLENYDETVSQQERELLAPISGPLGIAVPQRPIGDEAEGEGR